MQLIGENIHIISKSVKEALLSRDENFVAELVRLQSGMDFIDLNVGPAKGALAGVLPWLVDIIQGIHNTVGISFDTTNFDEIVKGFQKCKNPENTFINSTSADEEKFNRIADFGVENGANIIALTMSKDTGIPKTSDERLELAFNMYEKFVDYGISPQKVYFDPLIIPITADQSQAIEAINTIKMINESFDPPARTVIGLSNISNGCPVNLRPLINKVFAVLAFGAGLDAAIIDAKDKELVRVIKMLENNAPERKIDELYLRLASMISNFEELEGVVYNVDDKDEYLVIKTAGIILNKEIYSNSFTQI